VRRRHRQRDHSETALALDAPVWHLARPRSAAGAVWANHLATAKLEREMIEKQLEAAKWPDFGG
jgi:hypothetical protein